MNAKLITAALIVSIATKNLWEITFRNLYFVGDATAWLLFSFVVYRLSGDNYWLNRISLFSIWLCVSDVIDAIVFDPYVSGWNEWISAAVIFILVFKKRKKAWQKQRKNQAGLL